MKFKYTITADINSEPTIDKEHEEEYTEAVQEAVEERVNTMFKKGWYHAEFNSNITLDIDGEPNDGVLFFGWITLKREIENE